MCLSLLYTRQLNTLDMQKYCLWDFLPIVFLYFPFSSHESSLYPNTLRERFEKENLPCLIQGWFWINLFPFTNFCLLGFGWVASSTNLMVIVWLYIYIYILVLKSLDNSCNQTQSIPSPSSMPEKKYLVLGGRGGRTTWIQELEPASTTITTSEGSNKMNEGRKERKNE
jgi:hypothetical protein